MQVKLWTIPFQPETAAFDVAALEAFLGESLVLDCEFSLFSAADRPFLFCAVRYEPLPSAVPRAAPATAPPIAVDGAIESDVEAERRAARTRRAEASSELVAALTPSERALYDRLRAWRSARAMVSGVPPYRIITNRELAALVTRRPSDESALRQCTGLGEQRMARFGAELISALAEVERELSTADGDTLSRGSGSNGEALATLNSQQAEPAARSGSDSQAGSAAGSPLDSRTG